MNLQITRLDAEGHPTGESETVEFKTVTLESNDGVKYTMVHIPHRGSDIEAWIKNTRDHHKHYVGGITNARWEALDDLLEEYRLRADTGEQMGPNDD